MTGRSAEPVERTDGARVPEELVDYVDAADRPVRRGPRGRAGELGLHYRVAATVCLAPGGLVLVYRRPAAAPVYGGCHDVLIGGSVRAGESYQGAAGRELAEELGLRLAPREIYRARQDSPIGPCWLAVHQAELPDGAALRPDRAELDWYGLVPAADVLAGGHEPFVPAGRAALARLLDRHPRSTESTDDHHRPTPRPTRRPADQGAAAALP
ncbi:NUDIX domain-containing protein [Kitasatospora sp. NPDC002227]|uniref:NUDIX domain-containing protein n=1 Tax=Kitasatospora sp. NPDC002227 TaxID=3154773 RepID=UPI0033180A1B